MKTKVDFMEIARFMICMGIACIGWVCNHYTGSLF